MELPVKYFSLVIYDDCSNEIFWLEIPDYNTDIIISVDKNQHNKITKKIKKPYVGESVTKMTRHH
jgi:hypothetical protein